MKKIILIIVSLLIIYNKNTAQDFNVKNLKIEWEIATNDYQKTGKTLSLLRIKNDGTTTFAKSGWTIFFNFARKVDAAKVAESNLKIVHYNGDLYSLSPMDNFQGIEEQQQISLSLLTTEWLLNGSDAPAGFYVIFDDNPTKGFDLAAPILIPSTKVEQTKRFANDNLPVADALWIYHQNEKVKQIDNQQLVKIFPTPKLYQETLGTFEIASNTSYFLPKKFKKIENELHELLDKLPKSTAQLGKITVVENNKLSTESYLLDIKNNEIVIAASGEKGVFYAIQSLKTLCPPNPKERVLLPYLKVEDEPRFGYRGLHLDVARNFTNKAAVLKVLDLMALYKLNKFHFHLTEDEAWRLEIPGLPELTEIGAKRGHTLDNKTKLQATYGTGFTTTSSYYTKADFIEILKYATSKQIEVIVELEFAGHARAAIKSMDARYDFYMNKGDKKTAEQYLLRDLEDKSPYESVQQFNDNVVCVALPSTYQFIEKVTLEIIKMYRAADAPLTTIHIGGDEVPNNVWVHSPVSQRVIKENNLNNEYELSYYFLNKVNAIFKKYGLHTSGWEEIGLRKTKQNGATTMIPNPDFVNESFTTYVWNNVIGWGAEDLVYRLANAGYKVVFTPVTNTYFDLAYAKHFDEPGYYWGEFIDEEKPFRFAPTDYYKMTKMDRFGNAVAPDAFKGKDRLTDYGKQNLLGIQGCLWSENIKNQQLMEYQLLPKLLGLAERAWSKIPTWETENDDVKSATMYNTAWSDFITRMGRFELPRLSYYHGGFAYRIPPAGVLVENNVLKINCLYPSFNIRYTLDGSEPTLRSLPYTSPVTLNGNEQIKVKVFDEIGRGSR